MGSSPTTRTKKTKKGVRQVFIVKDRTAVPYRETLSNDVKTVADIIIGITGDENAEKNILPKLGDMGFGDTITDDPRYTITCVKA